MLLCREIQCHTPVTYVNKSTHEKLEFYLHNTNNSNGNVLMNGNPEHSSKLEEWIYSHMLWSNECRK